MSVNKCKKQGKHNDPMDRFYIDTDQRLLVESMVKYTIGGFVNEGNMEK